jgi:CBS-domain-containing membrane protein
VRNWCIALFFPGSLLLRFTKIHELFDKGTTLATDTGVLLSSPEPNMTSSTRSLLDRTAEELMSREVVTIPQETSLRAAAHWLMEWKVSGAPVIDSSGRCVGVLSRSDLVRFLDRGPPHSANGHDSGEYVGDWQIQDLEGLPTDDVAHFMSKNVITASPTTRVVELARVMCRVHIHRVLIADAAGRLLGIVSSMDILAVLAALGEDEHD